MNSYNGRGVQRVALCACAGLSRSCDDSFTACSRDRECVYSILIFCLWTPALDQHTGKDEDCHCDVASCG